MKQGSENKLPKVSIVIPCYNQANMLQDAVGSVFLQTYTDWEIIIVNDGSPDNTATIATEFIRKYPTKLISLINQVNQGLAAARNSGIRSAQGEYILPLDCDDMIHPQMLSRTLEIAESDKSIDIIHTDVATFGSAERVDYSGPFTSEALSVQNRLVYCSLYKKSLWEKIGGYDTSFKIGYEDWNFWRSAAELGAKSHHLKEFYFLYRVKEESMITTAMRYDTVIRAHMAVNHKKVHSQEELLLAQQINTGFELLELGKLQLAVKVFDVIFSSYNEQTFPVKLGSLNNLAQLVESTVKS